MQKWIASKKNNRGFTLVELMIVVVIMGILVAVAVPVYNSVTRNSREKTCHSNCEVLEKAAAQYMLGTTTETVEGIVRDGVTFNATTPVSISSNAEFVSQFSDAYIAGVNNPLEIFGSGCVYTFTYENDGSLVAVYCTGSEPHGNRNGTQYTSR